MQRIIALIVIVFSIILPLRCFANIAEGTSGSCKWVIDDNGVLTISPYYGEEGTLKDWGKGNTPWFSYCSKIKHAKFEKQIYAKTCFGMFLNSASLETVDFGLLNIDESENMQYMFSGCKSLKEIDMSTLNTEKVVYMDNMFAYCSSLKTIDLSTFNTYSVRTMNKMFYNCTSLEYADVSRFWTLWLSETEYMFFNCKNLKSVNMHFWDFRGIVNMTSMFEDCESLKSIDIQYFSFDRVSMEKGFKNCHSLESLDLTGFYNSTCSFDDLFTGCESLKKFYARNEDPSLWTINEEMFKTIEDPGKIILYVPRTSVELYKNAPGWSIFDVRAMEDEPKESSENTDDKNSDNPDSKSSDNPDNKQTEGPVTGVDAITTIGQSSAVYTISGNRLASPRRGVNIINGKKYFVK